MVSFASMGRRRAVGAAVVGLLLVALLVRHLPHGGGAGGGSAPLQVAPLDGDSATASSGVAVGGGQVHRVPDVQDERDSEALFATLEEEVLPLYYTRDDEGVPRGWIARIKRAIHTLAWRYNADRMVMDYVRHTYIPGAGGLSCDMPGMGS